MKDPAEIFTKKGTPLILIASRIVLVGFFCFAILASLLQWFPNSKLSVYWFLYLIGIYVASELIYYRFKQRGINLAFAFPLLFAIVLLNFFSILVQAQEKAPIINRAEHFATFILFAYIVWIFFLKYLPQKVWREHPYYTSLLVLSITSLAGVMNEIVELFLDQSLGTHTIGAGFDTSLDLLMNTVGAGLFLSVQLILYEGGILSKD
ncbi:MAG: hypothetical protein WD200_04690 [Candidatus Andersenbacteria bacterium]